MDGMCPQTYSPTPGLSYCLLTSVTWSDLLLLWSKGKSGELDKGLGCRIVSKQQILRCICASPLHRRTWEGREGWNIRSFSIAVLCKGSFWKAEAMSPYIFPNHHETQEKMFPVKTVQVPWKGKAGWLAALWCSLQSSPCP